MMTSLEAFAEAVSAAEGGAISTIVLFPLEVIKTRLQASSPSSTGQAKEGGTGQEGGTTAEELSVRKVVDEVYARSGIKGFWEGVEYAAIQSAIEKSVYFYAYSVMKGVCKLLTGSFSLRDNLIVGYLSEMVHLPLTVPLEVVITRIITSKGRITSLQQAFTEALQQNGIAGLYKGLRAYVVLCLKPAIQYTVFEQLRRGILTMLSRRRAFPVKSLTALQAFCLGALSRAIATLLIFPWIRAKKVIMADRKQSQQQQQQKTPSTTERGAGEGEGAAAGASETTTPPVTSTSSSSSSSSAAEISILCTITKTFHEEGPLALFRGIGPELTRGVLSAAMMLMIKEKLYAINRNLIVGRSEMRAYA